MEELPTKAEMRRLVRERMRAVPPEQLKEWSDALVANLQNRTELWEKPGTVALFGGLRNEPDLITDLLPWARARGWKAALFAVEGTELIPYEVTTPSQLKRGPLGVWEPVADVQRRVPLADLSLILVPGLAFSLGDGSRLGRGGGYYDRFLAQADLRARLAGICFQAQLWPGIPCEAHDSRVPEIHTETGLAYSVDNDLP